MSHPAITVENLSKAYRIGVQTERADSFVGALQNAAAAPWRNWNSLRKLNTYGNHADAEDLHWALRDVSFEVPEGEVLGVIGRNGAGKSTLLKILSRITEPTRGRATIRGRVSSLLEVGTGFHPELSGRENIYLNGTILGMRKREIDRKLDQIIDFSGVEKFLDTPIKRYSSGMKVRLAFAVAAHLEPEILIIDEVLAVGDADFQKKCLGKMQDVAGSGRTVMFVSHNMTAIKNLCGRCIYIDNGHLVEQGESSLIISKYLETYSQDFVGEMDLEHWPNRRGNGGARILNARLLDKNGNPSTRINRLDPITLEFSLRSDSSHNLNLSAVCFALGDGTKVLQLAHQDSPDFSVTCLSGVHVVRIVISELPLQCGDFGWAICVHSASLDPLDVVYDVLSFSVEDDLATSPRPYRSTLENGLCSLVAEWRLN